MKRNKLISILSTTSLATLSATMLVGSFTLGTLPTSKVNFGDTNLHAIGNSTSTQTTANWKYTTSNINTWEYYGKLRPSEINESQIKSLLNFTHYDAIINIEIQPITQTHLSNGYIEFKVAQTLNTYQDGVPTGSRQVYLQNNSNDIWSTQQFNGLLIPDKYNFKWRSVDEISQFLASTNKTYDTLTIQDVLLNMVERGDNFKLPANPTLNKVKLTSNEANDKKYGSVKITINFTGDQNNDWVNNTKPIDVQRSYTIRGLKSTDTNIDTTAMTFVEKTDSEVSSLPINTKDTNNPLNKYLVDGTDANLSGTLADLFPSEIVNFGGTDSNALLSLLTQGLYLDSTTGGATTDNKAAKLMYYGQSIDDATFSTVTGLDANITSSIGIKSVNGIADDSKGSLKLTYKYSKYDVYTNSIVQEEKSTTFPENTFKINPDANKTLQFSWKDESSLIGVSSSNKVVNDFEKNKTDADYVKSLSNQFINGSYDVYSKDRNVTIEFGKGQTISGGTVTPSTSNDTSVKVTLVFDSWSGERYLDGGVWKEGFKTEKTFNLKSFDSSIKGLSWKTPEEVKTALGDISKMSVIDVADKLFSKEIPLTTFVSGADNKTVVYNIVPSTGSINISIEDGNNIESNVYSGFLNEGVNNVTQFSWIPISSVSPVLLSTNLKDVTKELVIQEYLSKIPTFSGQTINPDDVIITPNEENNSLLVEVNLAKYNQETTDANRNFKIELKGFVQTKIKDGNSYVAPANLTVALSAVLGILVSVILITTLVIILIRNARLKKAKK